MGDRKCRTECQCIPGLKARLVSASPRHRSQPAGPAGVGGGLELLGVAVCPGVPRLSKLAWGGLLWQERERLECG